MPVNKFEHDPKMWFDEKRNIFGSYSKSSTDVFDWIEAMAFRGLDAHPCTKIWVG
jgi:hypothetical protein